MYFPRCSPRYLSLMFRIITLWFLDMRNGAVCGFVLVDCHLLFLKPSFDKLLVDWECAIAIQERSAAGARTIVSSALDVKGME